MDTTAVFTDVIINVSMDTSFTEWLNNELEKRNWSQSELARKGNLSKGAISHIMNGTRKAGNDVCEAIAEVLGYPPEYIFRKAGLLPPIPEETEKSKRLIHMFNIMPDDEQNDLLTYLEIKLQMLEKEGRVRK